MGDAPTGFRGIYRSDAEARAVYSEAAGIARHLPVAVAVPADLDDLALLIRWARESRTALIPRGSGSSMSGGAVGPGVLVDLSRWNRIGEVDVDRRRITVGPGAICAQVDAVARRAGLRFPVQPSSAAFCTIGGMTATNAAGAHSMSLGSMRRWVTALECVFADGSHAWVRRGEPCDHHLATEFAARAAEERWRNAFARAVHPGVLKDSSGYAVATFGEGGDLVDVLVGSEGTLALFASIELALAPVPTTSASVLATFSDLEDAARAAGNARVRGASACELLDRTFLELVREAVTGLSIPAGTEAMLLLEVASEGADAIALATGLASEMSRASATRVELASTPDDEHRIWALRHAASPTIARLDPSLRSMQFIEDGAVPPEHLAAYVTGVRAALDRHGARGVIFGHAGDAHVHLNPLIDVGRPDWRRTVEGLLDDVSALTASLGGTLTGEHGDGRIRTPLLERVWSPDARDAFRMVKESFDPDYLFNPGVKVAHGDHADDAIKYDPAAPPHPPAAGAALARVERDRAYATFRLDLL